MGKTSLLVIGRFGFFLLAGNSILIVEINTKQNNENSTKKELNSNVKDKQKIGNPTHPTPPHPPLPTPPHPTPPHLTPPHPTELPKLTKTTGCGGLAFSVLQ